MSFIQRISVVLRAKVLGVVDQIDDPRETLAYACDRQRELLAGVRRSLVEVSASKHQITAQIQRLEQRVPLLQQQAARAVAASREDLARMALERRRLAERQLEDLRLQLTEVGAEEQKLRQAERRFCSAVEAFQTKRDLLSARYTAAEAQYEAQRSLAGLSGELAGFGDGVHRAELKIERMQGRASALDDLLRSGVLDGLTGDALEDELRHTDDRRQIDEEMQKLTKQQQKGNES